MCDKNCRSVLFCTALTTAQVYVGSATYREGALEGGGTGGGGGGGLPARSSR